MANADNADEANDFYRYVNEYFIKEPNQIPRNEFGRPLVYPTEEVDIICLDRVNLETALRENWSTYYTHANEIWLLKLVESCFLKKPTRFCRNSYRFFRECIGPKTVIVISTAVSVVSGVFTLLVVKRTLFSLFKGGIKKI